MIRSFEQKLENIEDITREHIIPREIRMVYEHLDGLLRMAKEVAGRELKALPFHIERIAWAKANEKITSRLWWPLCLPSNPKLMAEQIFKDIETEMKAKIYKSLYDSEKAGELEKSDVEAPSSASV